MSANSPYPLNGLRVLEFGGLAPVPFAGMVLADFGADVVRIDRPGGTGSPDVLCRGKRSIVVNLKLPSAVKLIRRLAQQADVVIDPFRPGVLDKLGLGASTLRAENPRLIYAAITGYGQTGPMAAYAGHDINYVSLSGALSMLGREGRPPFPPGNILADFAGGGLMCVVGILLALHDRSRNGGLGRVVDVSMVEGVSYLATFPFIMREMGGWSEPPGENMLDGGAHFYDSFKTKDGKFIAVGSIEPQFYKRLIHHLNLPADTPHVDPSAWPEAKKLVSNAIASRTLAELAPLINDTEACVTEILDPDQARASALSRSRGTFDEVSGEPNPAPRLMSPACPPPRTRARPEVGQHTVEVLGEYGLPGPEIKSLLEEGVIIQAEVAKL